MQNIIDKSNMRDVILTSPKQLENDFELSLPVSKEKFESVIICGIGGSALPANIFSLFLQQSKIDFPQIIINRDYELPDDVSKSLILCISYSGNTEEVLSCITSAVDKKLKVAGIAGGGKLEEICSLNNIPFVKIPKGIQPRCGTGYIFNAMAKIFNSFGLIDDISDKLKETADELIKTDSEQEGKELADKLFNKLPIVYASNTFKSLARIWKIKFNENSKIPAFYNYFPELNHNEMVGYTNIPGGAKLSVIIIKDNSDYLRNVKRMELFAKLAKEKGVDVDFIEIKDGDILFKIFSTLMMGDWVSYYLALKYDTDPTPVKIVEDFKAEMEK